MSELPAAIAPPEPPAPKSRHIKIHRRKRRYDHSYTENAEALIGVYIVCKYTPALQASQPDRAGRKNFNPFLAVEYTTDCDRCFAQACKDRPDLEASLNAVLQEAAGARVKLTAQARQDVLQAVGFLATRRGLKPTRYFYQERKRKERNTI